MTGIQPIGRMEKPAFWRSFALFDGLHPGTLQAVVGAAGRTERPTGAVLFQRRDPGDYLVALASGRVRLTVGTQGGRELILRHAEAGDPLGEMALFGHAPRTADATALVPSVGHVVYRKAFDDIAAGHPDLVFSGARHFNRRLRKTTDQLESLALCNLEARAARFLLFVLRQIHGDSLPPKAVLRPKISQSGMAAVLGAGRPKVNRALQALSELGALCKVGDIWSCDTALLMTSADQRG
ncbi:MAG: Crp/Fnr family transcriptional regulator [Gemmobacter sp.]|nr:Crp/Fnr family transcriptional regulator [Gemmobacter sp.]